jgi:hypothetical protein
MGLTLLVALGAGWWREFRLRGRFRGLHDDYHRDAERILRLGEELERAGHGDAFRRSLSRSFRSPPSGDR